MTEFQRNGYQIFKSSFSKEVINSIASEIDYIHENFVDLKNKYPELYRLGEWSIRSVHTCSEQIKDFIFTKSFETICKSILGNNVDLYWCTTASKPAEKGKNFPWHQDAGYGKGPDEYITCWAALDHVDKENGCLWVIPGSHQKEILPHEYCKINDTDYAGLFLKDRNISFDTATPVILEPGDIVCMHSKLIHSSKENFSQRKRRGLIAAYADSNLLKNYLNEIDEKPVRFF